MDVEKNHEFLNIYCPIKRGVVEDIDVLEKIYNYIFENELRIDPAEHNFIITGVSMDLFKNQEKIGRMMFDTFNVPNLLFVNQTQLGLYGYGQFTGLILDLSDSFTHIIPYCDNFPMKGEEKWYNIGGKDLTEYMSKTISREFGLNISNLDAKLIKEKVCYCPHNFLKEYESCPEEINYELPDSTIVLKNERIICPEILFNPNIIYKEEKGIAEICYDTLLELKKNYDYDYWNRIYLLGGNSMINGFEQTLQKKLILLNDKISIIANNQREYLSFTGGCVVASREYIREYYISRAEFYEYYTSIFKQKKKL